MALLDFAAQLRISTKMTNNSRGITVFFILYEEPMIPIYPKSDYKSWGINGLINKSYLSGMVPERNLISLFTK